MTLTGGDSSPAGDEPSASTGAGQRAPDAVRRAQAFVRQEHPLAEAAFLGGSAATGEATEGSDLDILIVLPERWSAAAFVQTTRFEGQLVEAFVYGPASLQVWLDKGRADHRPVLDRLIAESIPLTDNALTRELARTSQKVLAAGPAAADPEDLQRRRYSLSAAVDDLADRGGSRPSAETAVLAWTVWREAAELALLTDRQWLGTGKWLVRELQQHGDHFALVAWAEAAAPGPTPSGAPGSTPPTPDLAELAREVLESAGGYLQEGYLRGEWPPDLGEWHDDAHATD